MKLTASEVRLIKKSGCDWDVMMRMLQPVKSVFKNCVITEISPLENTDMPQTTAAQMRHFIEVGQYVSLTKGGAKLKKKLKKDQMSLDLEFQNDGLKER